MEGDQTGFSGSPRPASSVGDAVEETNTGDVTPPIHRGQTYYSHSPNEIVIKNEPEDDPPTVLVSPNQGGPLPSLSEENWRAYYQHPLVVLNGSGVDDASSIYETYKLPPLAKFGKGLIGKMPAIWSVAVNPQEEELITAHTRGANSPPPELSATPLYLHREKADREDSVIQPVPEGVASLVKEEQKEGLTLLAPSAVHVGKQAGQEVQEAELPRQRQMQESTSPELPLEAAPYPGGQFSPTSYEPLGTGQYSVLTNVVVTVAPPQYGAQAPAATNTYTLTNPTDYYREPTEQQYAQAIRQHLATYNDVDSVAYVAAERIFRQQTNGYKQQQANGPHSGLTVDLPSPDSGIGETTVTPRDSLHQMFEYNELAGSQHMLQAAHTDEDSSQSRSTPEHAGSRKSASWNGHEYGRNADLDKVQIPKLFSEVGFHYFLESPISTSQRREDDRMTYINKGQYYGITLEYINDPERTLRSCTVKSTVMLVFREEKTHEDELKAWKFWHSRQHSVKQRILDADTKNSCGIIGQIEEVTHNAISFYWNPLDGPAKISVSVHCLSTDFSNQKGVKGFPLHIQVDTTDDLREGSLPIHRGYCQIKVFCDKGAERKTRDEERRAAKRKLTATGDPNGNAISNLQSQGSRKKIEEMYHLPSERSEFYSMSDLSKPPILFTPDEDADKVNGPELAFYAITAPTEENSSSLSEAKTPIELPLTPPLKKMKLVPADRELTVNSYWESVMLYVRRNEEDIFHPLHILPPSLVGLAKAIEAKFNINSDRVKHFYKRCKKGITVMMDDDIVRHYSNEDTFIIEVMESPEEHIIEITLIEV